MNMDFNKTIGSIPDGFEMVLFPEHGISITGASLRKYSGICAAWLQEQGHKTIGIHIANYPEFIYLLAGALRAGVKVVLLNALNEVETDIPVLGREKVAEIIENQGSSPAEFSPYEWGIDEPVISIMTSGTSGDRKRIDKSIKNFFGTKGVRPWWKTLIKLFRIRVYNCAPWYHNTGIYLLLLNLSGCLFTQITTGKFNPDKMRQSINSTQPNCILTTPTMLYRSACCGKIRLPSYIICTGEYLSDSTIDLLESNGGGHFLYSSYGTTEAGAISRLTYVFDSVKNSGKILTSFLRLSGLGGVIFKKKTRIPYCAGRIHKNVDVKVTQAGEIMVRSKVMIGGSETGHFKTGDIGYVDNGLLFITGRSGYVINRSGEKISPLDIEKVIAKMEGVKSVLVFGIPSTTHGEDICAAIESVGGAEVVKASDLENALPKYMIPQRYLFFDHFPLTESGKVNLKKLRTFALK